LFEIFGKSSIFIKILEKITGTLPEDQFTFFIISRSVLLRESNDSEKNPESYFS